MYLELTAKEAELMYATLMTQQLAMRRWIAHSKDQAEIEDLRKYLAALNDILDKFIESCPE